MAVALTAITILDVMQTLVDLANIHIGCNGDYKIIKIIAIKTYRFTFIDRGNFQPSKNITQDVDGKPYIFFWLDIATNTDVGTM